MTEGDGKSISALAETLLILAGDNAWAAARAFSTDYACAGDRAAARRWCSVAHAVLERRGQGFAGADEMAAAPPAMNDPWPAPAVPAFGEAAFPPPETLPNPPAEAPAAVVAAPPSRERGNAPIPLRARRLLAVRPPAVRLLSPGGADAAGPDGAASDHAVSDVAAAA